MVEARLHGMKDVSTWVNMSRISNKVMESIPGPMEGFMTVIGIRENNMAKVNLRTHRERKYTVSGMLENRCNNIINNLFLKIDLG